MTTEIEMAKLIYSAIASLDGYVEDSQGKFGGGGPKGQRLDARVFAGGGRRGGREAAREGGLLWLLRFAVAGWR